jgi:chromosome segregation ATPase
MSTATLYVEPEMTTARALQVIEDALACDSHFSVYDIGEDAVRPMLPLRQAVVTVRNRLDAALARAETAERVAEERRERAKRAESEAAALRAEREAALARAEAAERELDEVRIELGEERKRYRAAEQNVVWNRSDRDRAESEAAALRAEVERLKTDREVELEARGRYGFAAAERLAAAEALLRRVGTMNNPDDEEITAYFKGATYG